MLKYNNIKQKEMKAQGVADEEGQQSIHALEKLKAILDVMNRHCLEPQGAEGEPRKVRGSLTYYIDRSWQYNILLITCAFPELLSTFDKRVLDEIYKTSGIPKNVREAMVIEAIYLAEAENNTEEVDRLCCRFIAIGMDATEYEGEYIRPKETEILAHGHGKRIKYGDTHEGEFENGDLKGTKKLYQYQ